MLYPVILCGGSGTRLWPLSRKSYPKQFVPLIGKQSPFQATVRRLSHGAEGESFRPPLILTGSEFRFIVTEQLAAAGIDPGTIVIEPEGRNTAPAILAAALYVHAIDPDAVLLAAPSDHVIPDAPAFRQAVTQGMPALAAGNLVTFGIRPTRAEAGYGWLELAAPPDGSNGPLPVTRFVEKPDPCRAAAMFAAGNYLWNAGIFLFRATDMIEAFEAHAPEMLDPVRCAVDEACEDLGFLRLAPEPWKQVRNISLDYAVMEWAQNLSVVPFSSTWSDLGGWDAVWRAGEQDSVGVQVSGAATAIDCRDTLLRSDSERLEVVGIGLSNIIVAAMNDAVLVADMSRPHEVRRAVDTLKAKGAPQAVQFPKDYRPWGWFESLATGDRFQVKRIHVHPGAALSLQSHFHRSEHWIVVEGTARVTVDGETRLLTENQSVYVPLGVMHRLENPGRFPMVLIEVQTGAYVGEDDIVRYEDIYARVQPAKG